MTKFSFRGALLKRILAWERDISKGSSKILSKLVSKGSLKVVSKFFALVIRVSLVVHLSHLCCNFAACVALMLLVSGTRNVK